MIVGNGLIANSLSSSNFVHDDHIIFASGVSNSNETQESAFDKEKKLLLSLIRHNKKLIYFSSTSVNTSIKSRYIHHKLDMENLIEKNFDDYLIIRVPNIVGSNNNKYQLIGFLYDCLIRKIPITVYEKEVRFLLDVYDLANILKILDRYEVKKTDVFFNNGIVVPELLSIIEYITNNNFLVKNIDSSCSSNYSDNSFFISKLENTDMKFNTDVKNIIKKYFKNENINSSILY